MTSEKPPNLVLFVADEWRGDALGHAGDPAVHTPTLDRWVASEAVSFTSAFCQNPVCTPSRTSFLTGWYPHVRGHRTMHHLLRDDEPNLLRTLREAGYEVWWSGKNDALTPEAMASSVDVRNRRPRPAPAPGAPERGNVGRVQERWGGPEKPGYYSFYTGHLPKETLEDGDAFHIASALEWLARRPADAPPFCMLLTLFTPHCPYGVAEPWYGITDRAALPAPLPRPAPEDGKPRAVYELAGRQNLTSWGEEEWRELRGTYYDMIARTDDLAREIEEGLRSKGVWEDTCVFVFADHGDWAGDFGLPEKAQNLFDDALTRVPLVVKPPAGVPVEPGVRESLTELVDVSATVHAMLGVDSGHDSFGRSLLPAIAGDRAEYRAGVLCEGGRRRGEGQASERDSYQGVDGLYHPRMSMQAEDDVAHGKAVMWRNHTHKYVFRLYEDDELYDLAADPGEQRNRIHDPELADVAARLRAELMAALVETADVVPRETDHR